LKIDQTNSLCSTTGKDDAACKDLAATLADLEKEVTTADSDVAAQKKSIATLTLLEDTSTAAKAKVTKTKVD